MKPTTMAPMRMQQTSRKGSSSKEIFGGPHCITCAAKSVSPAMPACVTTSSAGVSTQPSRTQLQAFNDRWGWDILAMPTSSNGFNFLLLIIDFASRKIWLRPLTTKDAATVAKVFLN